MILEKNITNGIFGKKIIDNMKTYVLGSKGMLGRYVSTYLNDYYDLSVLNECYFVRRTPSMTTETITTMTTMTSTMW